MVIQIITAHWNCIIFISCKRSINAVNTVFYSEPLVIHLSNTYIKRLKFELEEILYNENK